MDKIKEKVWAAIFGFFGAALLCYIAAKIFLDIWWVLLIAALIAVGIILYIRFKKGKPKY